MIKSIQGDITELDFDAVVNAAGSRARHIIHAEVMGGDKINGPDMVRAATRNAHPRPKR